MKTGVLILPYMASFLSWLPASAQVDVGEEGELPEGVARVGSLTDAPIVSLAFSEDQGFLAAGTEDGQVGGRRCSLPPPEALKCRKKSL